MAYNPNHLIPHDNPHALWCAYCGEQVDPLDARYMPKGDVVHNDLDCLAGYGEAWRLECDRWKDKYEHILERDMS